MNEKVKYFAGKLGIILNGFGLFLLMPLMISLVNNESRELAIRWGQSFAVLIVFGSLFVYYGRRSSFITTKWSSYVLACIGSAALIIAAAIPYVLVMRETLTLAIFEASSGLTTTGYSIYSSIEGLPNSILSYRAMTEWVGGALFIGYFMLLSLRGEVPIWGEGVYKSNKMKQLSTVFKGAFFVLFLYLIMTGIHFIGYMISGLSVYEAFLQSMSSVSAGGFDSVSRPYNLMVHYALLFTTGISYLLWLKVMKSPRSILINREFGIYSGLTAFGTLLIVLYFSFANLQADDTVIRAVGWAIGAITTAGVRDDINQMPQVIILLLLAFSVMGGMVGSVTGGLKINRIRTVLKAVLFEANLMFKPSQVVSTVKLDRQPVPVTMVTKLMAIFIAWGVTLALGLLFLGFFSDGTLWSVFITAVGAITNSCYMDGLHPFREANLSTLWGTVVLMVLGRLEILPLLMVFNIKAWKY